MLSFCAKWLGEGAICYGMNQDKSDKRICRELWKLINKADIVIAHNGDKFDIKKMNARFLLHGFNPPSPYQSIDTLKIARKYFKFDSNKLDDLARQLKLGRKVKHRGFELWLRCIKGDPVAWKTMLRYNKQDVILLEKVYLKMRGWIEHHPHMTFNNPDCPNCGTPRMQKRGFFATKKRRYQRFNCQNCGAWSKGKVL